MTSPERVALRRSIDAARRERIRVAEERDRAALSLVPRSPRPCLWCHETFVPAVHNQLYCRPAHAKSAWKQSEHGRRVDRDRKRRARARERQAA